MVVELGGRSSWRAKILSKIIRIFANMARWRVLDKCGITDAKRKFSKPLIWLFWHNRLFLTPELYRRRASHRRGYVFTSPSGDGKLIAEIMSLYGVGAILGSSNKEPIKSLRSLKRALDEGSDIVITPDGPRGPRQLCQPGVAHLAKFADCSVLPIRVDYDKYVELRSWDRFRLPLPLSRVDFCFGELLEFDKNDDLSDVLAKIQTSLG